MIYKRTRTLSLEQAAYIAGLVDGEGTVALTRRHSRQNRQLVICISSTERYLLEYVLEVVGAGRISNKRTYLPQHRPSFTYAIDNRQALDLLRQITPYLKTYKFKRARLVLDHYLRLTSRNGRYSPQKLEERSAFVEKFLALRADSI